MRFIERIQLIPDHTEPPVMLAYIAAQLDNYEVRIGNPDLEWDADMVVLQCNDIRDREYIIFNSKLVKDHDVDIHVAVCGDAVAEHYKEMGDDIDWYLSGDADHTLEWICNTQNNEETRSLPTGYPEEIEVYTIDILPTPDWDSWDGLEKHLAKGGALPVVVRRGEKMRSQDNIAAEVKEIEAKYGIRVTMVEK